MSEHITTNRSGFGPGFTAVTCIGEATGTAATGIGFGVLNLAPGERAAIETKHETAWLLMSGKLRASVGNRSERLARTSLFDEAPSATPRCRRGARLLRGGRFGRAHGLWQRQPRALRQPLLRPRRCAQRASRQGPGGRRLLPLCAHHLRPPQRRSRGRAGAGRGRHLPRPLVELSAPSPCPAGDLPLSLHPAARVTAMPSSATRS